MTLSSFFDLVAFTTATTGTGTITVGSAVAGARTPATAGIADGTTVSYSIKDGSNYESGIGVTGSSGTTLTRTVLSSSNSNTAISLSGTATVAYTALAQDLNFGMQQLGQIVTSGSQATVDFTSISQDFSSLHVECVMADTQSGTSQTSLFMKVNNDGTSGNYTSTARTGAANDSSFFSSIAATSSGSYVGSMPQSGNTSIVGISVITIPAYARTVWHKSFMLQNWNDDASFVGYNFTGGGRWKSTAAINRLTFSTSGTAFADGLPFTLYGLR